MVFYLSERSFSFRKTFLSFTRFTTLVVLCLTILTNSFYSSPFVRADEQDSSCTVTNETTKQYYNLSPLKKTEG